MFGDLHQVSVFDSVVQGGDSVWEGLRVYSGKIFKLEEHLDRLVLHINIGKDLKFVVHLLYESFINQLFCL